MAPAKKAKEHKVRYETPFPTDGARDIPIAEFRVPNIHYERVGKDGEREIVEDRDEPFVIKSGQTITVDEDTYQFLLKRKAILTPEKKAEQDRTRRKLLGLKSVREKPKKDPQTYSDEEMTKVFNDLPFEVFDE
jgi:hypothetical protein